VPAAISLGELAVRFGLELHGEPDVHIDRIANLAEAEPGSLAFLADSRHRRALASTRASAVIVTPADAQRCPVAALVCSNPRLSFAQIATFMYPAYISAPGIHPSAVIDPQAEVAASACIGAHAVIEAGTRIGERAVVGSGCSVQRGASIGADTQLGPNVTLYPGVRIGARGLLHAGVVVGADGFGLASSKAGWVKIPQVGSVVVGDDVEIGANTTIDRGAIEDTVIEDGVKLDNQIQIGHNCVIGAHTAVAGCTGISGSSIIGKRCMIGGGVGIAGQLSIADDVVITGYTLVTASIKSSGSYSSGMPAVESRRWRRMVAHLRRLDEENK
jgi:UDP-3-O-[3-hydroxymyristoyl] glucosamine N-acyltransferase